MMITMITKIVITIKMTTMIIMISMMMRQMI